jgi:spore coat polysaccharide biosynthesis protein SpsF (cytidylyltransferase family)
MFKYVAVLILPLTLFAATANSQMRKDPSGPPQAQPISMLTTDNNLSNDQRLEREQIGRLFAKRQAQLRIDTEKLVALAAELKQQVDKTGVDILSMDVVKKAQEIQKLAKSVQDKMKNAY